MFAFLPGTPIVNSPSAARPPPPPDAWRSLLAIRASAHPAGTGPVPSCEAWPAGSRTSWRTQPDSIPSSCGQYAHRPQARVPALRGRCHSRRGSTRWSAQAPSMMLLPTVLALPRARRHLSHVRSRHSFRSHLLLISFSDTPPPGSAPTASSRSVQLC